MALPAAVETVRDGGLNLAQPASMMPVVFGVTSAGPLETLTLFADVASLRDLHGEGPGVELAANILAEGGPIGFVRIDPSIAGSNGAVSQTGTGTGTVAISGTASFDALLRVRIVTGGELGAATFQHKRDGYPGGTARARSRRAGAAVRDGRPLAL